MSLGLVVVMLLMLLSASLLPLVVVQLLSMLMMDCPGGGGGMCHPCRSSLASSRWLLASLMQVVINISEVVVIMGVGHHPLETWWLGIVVVVH